MRALELQRFTEARTTPGSARGQTSRHRVQGRLGHENTHLQPSTLSVFFLERTHAQSDESLEGDSNRPEIPANYWRLVFLSPLETLLFKGNEVKCAEHLGCFVID